MKSFFITYNETKDGAEEYAAKLKEYILSLGASVVERDNIDNADCILILGGDGTVLRAEREFAAYCKPIMGINLGGKGFLTTTSAEEGLESINRLMKDEYTIDYRMKLKCRCGSKPEVSALNDIVISGGAYSHLIGIQVYVNEILFGTYEADGIIISTPTGSTGYNLSAGGPLVTPNVEAMIISPICPHSLRARNFVISANDRLRLKLVGTKHRVTEEGYVTVDGEDYHTLKPDEEIIISKSDRECRMCVFSSGAFIENINTKLS